jgi:hypothetical protein
VKTFWLIVAAVGGLVALFFAYKGNYESAFVAAAIGAAAWFLNYRAQVKQRLDDETNDD